MTGPGDRDERDPGSGWQEPAHLGRDDTPGDGQGDDADDRPNFADRRRTPREEGSPWTPPGWDLPPAERPDPVVPVDPGPRDAGHEPAPEPAAADPVPEPAPQQPVARRPRGAAEEVFAYQGDLVGVQGWALQHGWTISDGTAPEDAALGALIASAPASRISTEHRPAGVIRGRADAVDLVAFDVVFPDRRAVIPQYAVTAAPLLTPVPYFRLAPARFWKHRTGGLQLVESGDPAFDTRWVLYTAEDSPAVRRLAADATVRGMLLGTDDGDEFWAAAGYVAAIRPDGHRPLLVEHHARLLTAVLRAVTGGA
jgi:hypothetical protein